MVMPLGRLAGMLLGVVTAGGLGEWTGPFG
jgi:hypothetical protein